MDHTKIAVRVPMVNEVQFLFASEPTKLLKDRSLNVVLFVKEYVGVERGRPGAYLNYEKINR